MSPRPLQQAPFRVLVGANMPAVLVEIGFLSNPDEEKALARRTRTRWPQAMLDAHRALPRRDRALAPMTPPHRGGARAVAIARRAPWAGVFAALGRAAGAAPTRTPTARGDGAGRAAGRAADRRDALLRRPRTARAWSACAGRAVRRHAGGAGAGAGRGAARRRRRRRWPARCRRRRRCAACSCPAATTRSSTSTPSSAQRSPAARIDELIAVYAIVMPTTNLPAVARVQILVDGRRSTRSPAMWTCGSPCGRTDGLIRTP